jgi:Thermolysin metallopeptidase, alpha-helical domain/Thermolysin metallopeptidase, catalytic domain/Thrombospondin type 3 repeat
MNRLLLGLVAAGLAAFPAVAQTPARFGYALADQPTTASYTVARVSSFSTALALPVVTRAGVGSYTVRFPGLGSATNLGHVQVSGFGTSTDVCKVASWSGGSVDFSVGVRCFSGTAAHDSAFTVMVTGPEEGDTGLGYAWADQPSTASYAPSASYAFDAAGGTIAITRSAVGRYAVRFPGLGGGAFAGGTVQVTPYGTGSEHCQVVGWATGTADLTANVACFTPAGAAVDTRYTLLVRAPGNANARYSYAWADQPTAASYTPNPTWASDTAGGSIFITRSAVGTYAVSFDGQANPGRPGLGLQVSAYNSAEARCVISSSTPNGTNQVVGVKCFGPSGALDTRFVLLVAGRKHYPADAMMDAIAAFEHASDRPAVIRIEGGVARFVSGSVPASGADPVASALTFLGEYRALYGLTDPARDLFLSRVFTDTQGTHLFFGSRNGNRVVYGVEIGVHLDAAGVTSTSGIVADGSLFTPNPTITERGAELLVNLNGGLSDAVQIGATAPFAYDPGQFTTPSKGLRPAWRIVKRGSRADGSSATIVYLVDGLDGTVVRATDTTRTGLDLEVSTGNHGGYNRDSCVWDSSTLWFTEAGPQPGYVSDLDGDRAFSASTLTYNAFFSRFGRLGIDGADGLEKTYVHYLSGWPNARYDADCRQMVFGDGMVTTDVYAHEVSHGISQPFLAYENDVGAINESYSDIFGAMVDGNWLMGEATRLGALRDMADPPVHGQPDHLSARLPIVSSPDGYNDFGYVHTNSGIHNKAAYLMAEGGTHHGITVAPMGKEKTWRVFYDTLPTLTHFTTFDEARRQTVEKATAFARGGLYGFTPAAVCSVTDAFAAVGIGPSCDADEPPGEGDHIPASFDNCPTVRNPDQRDQDHDDVGDACDADTDNDGICDVGGPLNSSTPGVPSTGCVAGPSGRDNCRFVANAGQSDTDGDGIGEDCDDNDGDHVFNVADNCPAVANTDQRNFDGDLFGDACDLDNDNDGRNDAVDNCPRGNGDATFDPLVDRNSSQTDSDGDAVGDLCDLCPTVADTSNIDTDSDRVGDVCDLDDDNDAVCDSSISAPGGSSGVPAGGCTPGVSGHGDNCRTTYNPDQIDLDHNGTGIACDSNEVFTVSGDGAGLSNLLGQLTFWRNVVRIPIWPCLADGCPDWLDLKYFTQVLVSMPTGFDARLINGEGTRVATAAKSPNGTALRFQPQAGTFYRFPKQQGSISATSYFLEIVAPPNFQLGGTVPIGISTKRVP